MKQFIAIIALLIVGMHPSFITLGAATVPAKLTDRLSTIRNKILSLQENLLDSLRSQKEARENIRKIQVLLRLQQEERQLGEKRIAQLENTISELQMRRGVLKERILVNEKQIRKSLKDIAESSRATVSSVSEKLEAPRRRVLSNLVGRNLREIETFKADLADAEYLEARIGEEEQQLAYLFGDLKEQQSVLELNRQLQLDLIAQKHAEGVAQLENYRKLKSAQASVENLITDFNSRLELERTIEAEKAVSRSMMQGAFAKLKGKLPLPVEGKILSRFGPSFDSKSNLQVFRKGIEISVGGRQPVKAVSAGKVAYSGFLPDLGQIAIIDHGNHFYSLCGHLGTIDKQAGASVAAGEPIGTSDDAGSPIYFEIRARNIAVNPLQWVSN